jgi:hypothetical protein
MYHWPIMKVDWLATDGAQKNLELYWYFFPEMSYNLQILPANGNQDQVSNYLSNLADP